MRKKIRNTRITAPANRFNETSHLRVSVIPTTNSVITCPVLSQDMEIDEGESMVQVWKCHCSNSCSKIEGMHRSGTSQKVEMLTHSF
ncbi:hypothetical protein CEXT_266611 [Caerostris extrusa]|uniref:Uncharacterized protein n=1 Tax=Caerostris extrusa TaxID=172846 RepID=A0AAV4WHC0_CAEEX|nr:hypothetical protein CEXT_266611 [Caerostris extrusa]